MSKLLVNQGGRVVEFDDEFQFQEYSRKPGFRVPSAAEEAAYLASRKQVFEEVSQAPVGSKGIAVHFKTVRQSPDGYGMSQGHLVKELRKLGFLMQENYDGQKIGFLYAYPYSIQQMETPVRIVYTMFESDKIPADWPEYLHQADKVLVPSTFVKETMAKFGVEAEVVPLGYNQEIFKPLKRPSKLKSTEPFTFLHYNGFNLRKGFKELLEAFTEEFSQDEPVKLIIKTTMDTPIIPLPRSVYTNIEVLTGVMTEEELLGLHQRSDCFVYPSRGEGFGLTPLEAMATGMTAIVPNAHGIAEYFNPDCMIEVEVSGECPGLYNRFKGQDVGKMVICDKDDLKKKMRWAYTHQKQIAKMGEKAAVYAKNYTFEKTAKKLAKILTEFDEKEVVKRRDTSHLRVETL